MSVRVCHTFDLIINDTPTYPEDGGERSGHAEDGVPPLRAPQPHRGPGGGRGRKDSGQQEIQFAVECWKSVLFVFGVNNIQYTY